VVFNSFYFVRLKWINNIIFKYYLNYTVLEYGDCSRTVSWIVSRLISLRHWRPILSIQVLSKTNTSLSLQVSRCVHFSIHSSYVALYCFARYQYLDTDFTDWQVFQCVTLPIKKLYNFTCTI
jgi:hypothetical protein